MTDLKDVKVDTTPLLADRSYVDQVMTFYKFPKFKLYKTDRNMIALVQKMTRMFVYHFERQQLREQIIRLSQLQSIRNELNKCTTEYLFCLIALWLTWLEWDVDASRWDKYLIAEQCYMMTKNDINAELPEHLETSMIGKEYYKVQNDFLRAKEDITSDLTELIEKIKKMDEEDDKIRFGSIFEALMYFKDNTHETSGKKRKYK